MARLCVNTTGLAYRLTLAGIAIFSLLARFTGAEIFTSIVHFEQVLHAEEEVANRIQAFVKQEEDRLQRLRELASDYRRHSRENLEDPDTYFSNPLNAYLLVKKFTSDWYNVVSLIRDEGAAAFAQNISSATNFPDIEDLKGAARALLRIQHTYEVDTAQMATGDVKGLAHTRPLTGDDCLQLGKVAYEINDNYHTILWMQEALARLRQEGAGTATIVDALGVYSTALYKQGNVEAALITTEEILSLDPTSNLAIQNSQIYRGKLKGTQRSKKPPPLNNKRNKSGYHTTEEFDLYERLCRGEQTQVNPFRDRLYCHYKRTHPFYYIRPLKEEILYEDPYITVFHDLITDTEIQAIKNQAKPKLSRSILLSREKTQKVEEYRISKSAWLFDSSDPLIRKVSEKVSMATGLSLRSAEELQVLNYGLGGQYEPHADFVKEILPGGKGHFARFGNRISTSLYYMTDVPGGGGTVFPHLGVHVRPEKGMMLHWYNLLKNGQGDKRTIHAGCPVLVGSKWVCNKWIHLMYQEFRRPCGLNADE